MSRRSRRARERSVDLTRYERVVPDWRAFLEAAARPEPTVFRVRTGRIGEIELTDRLTRQGFRLRPLEGLPSFFQVVEEPFPVTLTLEHWHGLIYVQQASTGVAAPALGPAPGERVLDLCSAPGGKTTHLAELMGDRGCLVANEIDERRIRGLLGNVYRLGHTNILSVASDGRDFPEGALFDRVLVDAPCSGEGTLRRRAGEAPNQSPSFLGYVTAVQRRLLERAVRLTRPGGTILYVTCTFAPEENEAVVSEILRDCPVEIEPLGLPVPHAPGLAVFEGLSLDPRVEAAARIYPYHLDSGGLFLAKLRRLDGDGGAADREGPPSSDEGWSPVPARFPGDGATEDEARARIESGVEELRDRYGVDASEQPDWAWTMRGGRAWLHTVDAWPLAAWQEGGWRGVSIGQRSLEFDSYARLRPTNDFLRLAGGLIERAAVDVTTSDLGRLLDRDAVPAGTDLRGPVALRLGQDVLGRGVVTGEGLVSEIPKARAADLRRALAASDPEREA